MFKRISSSVAFSAFIFAMIGLFPVIAPAQAPDEPQQGAINTSRSNIKNTNRTTGEVMVVLNEVSGKNVASCRLTNTNNDRKLSGGDSVFDCGVPAEGDYVLILRSVDGKLDDVLNLIRRITVTGTVDGDIEKECKLKANKVSGVSPAETQRWGDWVLV
jgi:hypothetical protein